MGYIYKITNIRNKKNYIGQTTKERPSDRFSQHRYLATHPEQEKSISYLHRAMLADGLENFVFEVIEEVDNSFLNEREIFWIKEYNSLSPNGYNLTTGGEGTPGFSRPQTAEERAKRKESNKEFYIKHPEAKIRASENTKKLWENDDYRKRVIESQRKYYKEHPDKFAGENNPMYGITHTEEALQKIRAHAATRKIKIAQLDKDTLEIIKIFNGIKEAEKELNVSHGWLSKAARANKIAYGYRWKIVEEV